MLLDYYNDPHTYSNTDTVKITHIHLELDVDFEHQVLKGHAILHLNKEKDCKELILDTWGLHIYKTAVGHENQETHFSLGEHDELLGAPLSVEIEENTEIVTIYYTTSPNAKALQWMLATDISNKHLLFSQSQAILARSWVPLQDSPSVRFTYNASITVPTGYLPLMSAENPVELREDNKYMFKMEQAIPSYLLAIAVGNFVFQPLGDRTGVYAEPNLIEASAWEFADMQKMLEAGEALYGAYRWDRYDVLVLPGSFPFGGMENPRLTFATPTILAGDRSLVSLVAHELAHSWSGNLVTNATWDDFWLNEGHTVYFEHRIMEAIEGIEYAKMLEVINYQDLVRTVDEMGHDNEDTCLKLNMAGKDPDEGVNAVAYIKGCYLLKRIEDHVGRIKWDAYLNKYFQDFAFKSIDTEQWISYIHENLFANDEETWTKINVQDWIYKPGIPVNINVQKAERFEHVNKWIVDFDPNNLPSIELTKAWSTHEWLHYLRGIKTITASDMAQLNSHLHLNDNKNREIQFEWYKMGINNDYKPAINLVNPFLLEVGRGKFVTPLYLALIATGKKELAIEIYQAANAHYHPVVQARLKTIFQNI